MNKIKKIKSIILGVLLIVSILTILNPVSSYSIQGAIDAAPVGGVVIVPAGTYNETITITKSITLQGADKSTTIIMPAANGTEWISIQASDVHIKNLTFDGTGYNVYQAITTRGSGSITNCIIKNIRQQQYRGIGIRVWHETTGQEWEISDNKFINIERIGVYVGGQGNIARISNNILEGSGVGDWLQYGVEVGRSGLAYIENNHISKYQGDESGWGSSGILVTAAYGPKSTAYITGNTITNNTTGVAVGYVNTTKLTDDSIVTLKCNKIYNNIYGIEKVGGATVIELPCSSQLPMGRILGIIRSNHSKNNGNGGNSSGTD